jgi:hypothetical protein
VVEAVGNDVTRFQPGDESSASARARTPSTHAPARTSLHPAGQPHLRAGGGGRCLRVDRPAGRARPREGVPGAVGTHHRCVGRSGDLRRAACQGVRGRGVRRMQLDEGGHGPIHRCRPGHRLHARRLRGGRAAVRRHPGRRRELVTFTPPARTHPEGNARHRGRRNRRPVAGGFERQLRRCCPRS